jgi:hypothetical protein
MMLSVVLVAALTPAMLACATFPELVALTSGAIDETSSVSARSRRRIRPA